jgi:predicted TIM-barrel fold metal-dependent hydrolase
VGADRVIFGTDMPLIDPFFGYAKVLGTQLSDQEKALILGGNILRLVDRSNALARVPEAGEVQHGNH